MKVLLPVLLIVAMITAASPRTGNAQVRVSVNVGLGYHGGHGWSSARWHSVRGCRTYSRFGCYPERVVIIRRPVHRAPVVAWRPRHRVYRRHW